MGFPGSASGKESSCQCRRQKGQVFSPWVGRSPGVGNGNPFQYVCLGNPMERGTWRATVHRVAKSQTLLSTHMHIVNLQYCVSFRCLAECFSYIYIYILFPSIFWDGWMASLTGWTWVWVRSRSWWWTGKPGVLQSMGSQRVRHDWATELILFQVLFPCRLLQNIE